MLPADLRTAEAQLLSALKAALARAAVAIIEPGESKTLVDGCLPTHQ